LLKEVPVGIWDDGIKSAVPGFLVVMGVAVAAIVILPALAIIARPVTKAAIRLYFDLADDVQEVVAHHRVRRGKHSGLFHNLLCEGCEELVAEGLEVEAEETMAGTVLEGIAEIL
jgi:hypothetical protein